MTSKMVVRHKDSLGKNNSETFNTTLTVDSVSDTAVAAAVDTWERSFVALSKDTYDDVSITESVSINEILSE